MGTNRLRRITPLIAAFALAVGIQLLPNTPFVGSLAAPWGGIGRNCVVGLIWASRGARAGAVARTAGPRRGSLVTLCAEGTSWPMWALRRKGTSDA